jgi:hypothetical protein
VNNARLILYQNASAYEGSQLESKEIPTLLEDPNTNYKDIIYEELQHV